MDGQVYRIPIQGRAQNLPHPHVVVVELDKECWMVPAFGGEGHEVRDVIDALARLGFRREQVAVPLDNARHVRYAPGYSGKTALWLVARAFKITKKELRTYEWLGTMDDDGLLQVARGIQRLAQASPDRFSPALQKKIAKLIARLTSGDAPSP